MGHALFVYGTLLFDAVLVRVVGRSFPRLPAQLAGYERRCLIGKPYPGLIEVAGQARSAMVHGELCRDLDDEALALLDAYEDDGYERREVTVTTADGRELGALAYVVPASQRRRLSEEPWDPERFRSECLGSFVERLPPLAASAKRAGDAL